MLLSLLSLFRTVIYCNVKTAVNLLVKIYDSTFRKGMSDKMWKQVEEEQLNFDEVKEGQEDGDATFAEAETLVRPGGTVLQHHNLERAFLIDPGLRFM